MGRAIVPWRYFRHGTTAYLGWALGTGRARGDRGPRRLTPPGLIGADYWDCTSHVSPVIASRDNTGATQWLLLPETSGTCGAGVDAPVPPNAGTNPRAFLPSVPCGSAGYFAAVGTYDDSTGTE